MELIPIATQRVEQNDDLISLLLEAKKEELRQNDVLVVSSKVVATAEGRVVELGSLSASPEAEKYAQETGRSPEFCQAVLNETKTRNGKVVGTCPGAILTELKPDGLLEGTIFTANAGLDESNAKSGTAIGWPENPVVSAKNIQNAVSSLDSARDDTASIGVIISDSCCRPRRRGITAFALAVAGFDPLSDEAGKKDVFGKELRITQEAIADQLATAANALMGNAGQAIPAVIVRESGIGMTNFAGWVPGIPAEDDLFRGIL